MKLPMFVMPDDRPEVCGVGCVLGAGEPILRMLASAGGRSSDVVEFGLFMFMFMVILSVG
jgi:hypothetical protein